VKKRDREIMEILEAFDLTRCPYSAAALAGCDPKTVRRYVALRDAGRDPAVPVRRERALDGHLEKIEELVERSRGRIRADVVHERLVALGFQGSERTTRRAVAEARAAWKAGRRRVYRPWITEPGMWLQFDWGTGPKVADRPTLLWCAWLSWSRYRIVIPTFDRTLGTVLSCLDATLRELQGAPTYVLTDNEKTVTIEHVAGIAVRHPELVAAARHYGVQVLSCVPHDPESKGGVEATVRIAKADLVPTEANLLAAYASFAALAGACRAFMDRANGRPHRETHRAPVEMLAAERAHLHVLPHEPHTACLGQSRRVDADDRTVRFGSVRYSTPPGFEGAECWCRVEGEELVIVARAPDGLCEIARHRLSTPGNPRILDVHYPEHRPGGPHPPRPRPRTPAERDFLALGPGAERWLVAAAAKGVGRIPTKMGQALALARFAGAERVERALGLAAQAGRFGEDDLRLILAHLDRVELAPAPAPPPSERHSAQPGTGAWAGLGR
jgi:transposase